MAGGSGEGARLVDDLPHRPAAGGQRDQDPELEGERVALEAYAEDPDVVALPQSLRAELPAPWSTGDEDRLGMHGLHARLAGEGTIGARARGREPEAQALLASWAEDLAGFLAGRVEALAGMGIQVDRVVVGARGGELLCDGALEEFARLPLEKSLARRLDRPMSEGFLVPSSLRAAPAIGVAAASLGLVEPA